MIQYIYFVKCPNCEDEHFDFFDEAKEFALGCLSQKPIITQIEVDRNDFGECTDSHDLGTVWTWEETMKDTTAEAEPTKAIFTRDDLKDYTSAEDTEFASIDNSVDFEPEISEISDEVRKPVPEGMTLRELVEAMEENEDTVECVGCEELFPKDECFYKDGIGWLCPDCEDTVVKCTWCEELYDKGSCRYEVNLGWLCDRCQAAIMSRGETLTFKEGSYWDFLDEDIEKPINEELEWHTYKITFTTKANPDKEQTTTFKTWQNDVEYAWRKSNANIPHTTIKKIELVEDINQKISFTDLVKDSINHLVNGLGKDPWADGFADEVIADIEKNYEVEVPEGLAKYNSWANSIATEVSRQVNKDYQLEEEVSKEFLDKLESSEEYRARLDTCPECGSEKSFDKATGFCLNCGFN